MKNILLFVTALFVIACNSSRKSTKTDPGFTSLFDGKTMKGWRTYQNKPADSWMVKDGMLYCKGSTTDKSDRRADLITDDTFENFDLELDWKIAPQGNSGILYMVTEAEPTSYLSGPEYQLIDDVNFPEKLEDWQRTAANYAMNAAPNAHPKAASQWNHTRIVVNKGHVEHWLNGEKVVEYDLWTDDWKKRKAEGKWKDAPAYGMSKIGRIALQDHGSEAWFKNIEIKRL
ncbi:MAG: 3-keto-disaccharide hydrolase [Flavisolibacter sp.]